MFDSPLSAVLLLKELRQVTDWHVLGLYLEISSQELDKVCQQFLSEGVERCKAATFVGLAQRRFSTAGIYRYVVSCRRN